MKLIGCEMLCREICAAVSRSPHAVDLEFLPKGLHELGGSAMRERLQQAVDRADPARCEFVLLGYALCGNGLAGLQARAVPLVIPRAHDCIALLLGSRKIYSEYFKRHPGTYFSSMGWLERGDNLEQAGMDRSLQDLIAQYGEGNGRYLYEQLCVPRRHYRRLAYIETGLEPNDGFERSARSEAARHGWSFEKLRGDLSLLNRLLSGPWEERDFLTVAAGRRIEASYDEGIFRPEEAVSV